jgi:serine/threonine-protein kinase
MVLLPLLGLLAGAGIAAALFQALAGGGPSSPAEAADLRDQGGTTVTIDAEDYIGRPVDEVVDELAALGLDVARRQVPTDDAVPGAVTDVAPDGVLEPDDTVVVSYAAGRGAGRDSGDGTAATGAAVEPDESAPDAVTPTGTAGPTDAASDGETGELPGEAPTETDVVTDPTDTTTPSTATSTSESSTSSSTAPSTETSTPTSDSSSVESVTTDG